MTMAGRNWHAGEMAVMNRAEFPSCNETAIVEQRNGGVVMNIRTASERNVGRSRAARTASRAWSAPHFDETLTDPICAAGLVGVPNGPCTAVVLFEPRTA